jgi:hypothetical protein
MKILVGDKGNVDFDAPIEMSKEQKDRFMTFIKDMFVVVKETNGNHRTSRIGSRSFVKPWDDEELNLLLNIEETNEDLQQKLGRTWMSVDIKRGPLMAELLDWANREHVKLFEGDTQKAIRDFLVYKKSVKLNSARKRKRLKKLKAKQAEIKEELEKMIIFASYRRNNEAKRRQELAEVEKEIKVLES